MSMDQEVDDYEYLLSLGLDVERFLEDLAKLMRLEVETHRGIEDWCD